MIRVASWHSGNNVEHHNDNGVDLMLQLSLDLISVQDQGRACWAQAPQVRGTSTEAPEQQQHMHGDAVQQHLAPGN
jgi:hypothetical protein